MPKLLQSELNVTQQDEDGNSALMYASAFGFVNFATLLLKTGIEELLTQRNNLGFTAEQLADQNGHGELAKLLRLGVKNSLDENSGAPDIDVVLEEGPCEESEDSMIVSEAIAGVSP